MCRDPAMSSSRMSVCISDLCTCAELLMLLLQGCIGMARRWPYESKQSARGLASMSALLAQIFAVTNAPALNQSQQQAAVMAARTLEP